MIGIEISIKIDMDSLRDYVKYNICKNNIVNDYQLDKLVKEVYDTKLDEDYLKLLIEDELHNSALDLYYKKYKWLTE